jgi:uncharacterized protein
MEPDGSNLSTQVSSIETAPSPLAYIFIGPEGLRAGWRFLVYIAGFVGMMYLASHAIRPLLPRRHSGQLPALWVFAVQECELLFAVYVPALLMSRLERRPVGAYGLPVKSAFGRSFWVGALWGIVAISVLLVTMRAAGAFYYGTLALHGVRVLKFVVFWAVLFVIVGLAEEFLLRGYTQFTLSQGIGFWPAAILLSAAFGGSHLFNPGENWVGALGAAVIGLFFCLTLRRTGTLWFAVGMHASWDWGETFLYSVPDSGTIAPGHLLNSSFQGSAWLTGGSVGPEGSVLVFVLIGAMWVVFDRMYPARRASGNQFTTETQGHREREPEAI